jgi:quercetin dioxygenase-like cupin family protein
MQKLRPNCPTLSTIGFEHLSSRYGDHMVFAAKSSRLRDDTTDEDQGGMPESELPMAQFVQSIVGGGSRPTHDYVKMTDENTRSSGLYGLNFHGIGVLALRELAAELRTTHSFQLPSNLTWSLWAGARGSTTALHVDDVAFNVLYVLEGAKRVLLIDPDKVRGRYACEVPRAGSNSCWANGVDVLKAPPPEAVEVMLRAGDALVLPPGFWHAVENLAPTLAVGLNEYPRPCSMRRYQRVRQGT